ncbi:MULTISPECIES: CCA tRNA nucleotidyltransferase [unclassified Chelatococcus]|uniref:CCA tRNA nucleotidyltransferase n=1 Tax=unclassified Chelatococcus TaxID=2638111 RepID=UPI001BCF9F1D|nr:MULTISPECIES: CCA tRNA nucleotidyltransferase [unclassified Chelatococcus]MBS7697742.1 CCA tRNA nucleotidyltransferase [Chelatococcus sp. YT9]MBX3558401.1 CCA tRNA nucleotidyltransferase [Chelatococcus sp.]
MRDNAGPSSQPALAGLLARPSLQRLFDALAVPGEETRVVGGAVRNALLDRPINDIDCATTMTPREVVRRAAGAGLRTVPTGLDHGTVTVLVDQDCYEVTTLREDVATDGRRATVAFSKSFAADAARRDFTINALYLSRDGRVHDLVGGLADIAARRVRFIGDPDTRIREDYLRILRFFRFHAAYADGPLDADGLAATIRQRAGLDGLSRERVRAELLKLLVAARAVETVDAMMDAGLLLLVIGGVGERGRLARAVAGETAHVEQPDGILRLAALAVTTSEDALRLRHGLRLSNGEFERLSIYARLLEMLRSTHEPLNARAIRRLVVTEGLGPVSDVLAVVTGEPRPKLEADALPQLDVYREGRPIPTFRLSGKDVLALGVEKGPAVGRVLERARALWLDADCPDDEASAQALLAGAVKDLSGESSQE